MRYGAGKDFEDKSEKKKNKSIKVMCCQFGVQWAIDEQAKGKFFVGRTVPAT